MPKIDQFPGPIDEWLITETKETKETKETEGPENKADFPCLGYHIHSIDGDDFDCEYEFAGDIDCDECMINGGDCDPRYPKWPEWPDNDT